MAGGIGAANIRLGADVTGIISGMANASQAVSKFTTQINTNLTRAYRQADVANKTFRNGLTRLGSEIQDIGQKMSLFGTLPALFATGAAYKSFADLEKLGIGLNQYGESLETVKALAKLPNVSIEGAAQSLIQLRAVGVQSDLAQKGIKAFANALTAAGKSSADLNPALTNVVQMLSTGVVSSADVKELANRIPQARKALMDAFGTASGEELTKIGPEKVVNELINQLGKIPPVAGGAGMALEKLGDASQFSAAQLGKIGDKAFDITGKINDLADLLETAVDKFADADPKTQKLVLSLGGLAAVAPVVIVALGAVVSAGAALAAGLGVAAATVGIVATAIVVGGALIITHWDEVKRFLTETGVWTTLAGLVESTMDIISSAFETVGGLLSGNWETLWTGIQNITAGAVNFLNTAMFGLVKQIGLAVSALAGLLQMDGFSKWLREKSHGLDAVVKQLNLVQQRAPGQSVVGSNEYGKQFAADDAQTKAWEAQQDMLSKIKPIQNVTLLSVTELEKRLSELKGAYNSLKPGEEGFAVNRAGILKQVNQVNKLLSVQNDAIGKNYGNKEADAAIKQAIYESNERIKRAILDNSIAIEKAYSTNHSAISPVGQLDKRGITTGLDNNLDNTKRFSSDQQKPANFDHITRQIDGVTGAWIRNDIAQKKAAISANDVAISLEKLSEDITAVADQGKLELFAGIGQGIADLATETDKIENVGARIASVIGDSVSQIGKAIIAYALTMEGLQKALKVAFTSPYVALAVGVAAVAAGKILKNKASESAKVKLAKGGLADGPTLALVGDNPGAKFDPEVISPLSKLKGMISESMKNTYSGGAAYISDLVIKGPDIYVSFKRQEAINKALGIA